MDWRSNLKRAQSMSLSPAGDQAAWTKTQVEERVISVSRLVARYQNTEGEPVPEQKPLSKKEEPKSGKASNSRPEMKQPYKEAVARRDSKVQPKNTSNMVRSKSTSSLQTSGKSASKQQTSPVTIKSLRSLFEPQEGSQKDPKDTARSLVRSSSYKETSTKKVMDGDVEKTKRPAEKPKATGPAARPVSKLKDDRLSEKVVAKKRTERRKTIGGIDFELIAASQADENQRLLEDLRNSLLLQNQENLTVSVKDISALYMSKVAPQETANTPVKLVNTRVREPSPDRKSIKAAKMAQDLEQGRGNVKPPPSAEEHEETSVGLSREKLFQQRQKCELRRLLKHTHPELKQLDDVMNEELAEVLGSETKVAAGESGYEGEVFSRRLIFESCSPSNTASPYAPKRTAGKEKTDKGNSAAVVEESLETQCQESVKQVRPGDKTAAPDEGCKEEEEQEKEEERIIVDVKATRRIFEDQSRFNSDKFQKNGSKSGQKLNKKLPNGSNSNAISKMFDRSKNEEPNTDIHIDDSDQDFSRVEDVPISETVSEDETSSFPDVDIKTSAALFRNNPFISANVERENSSSKPRVLAGDSREGQDHPTTNVKSRAHLFESLPFEKIRRQNQDEVETMVENIKETLKSLSRVDAIHSAGSIVEVNETMIAKRAKFTLSEFGPKLDYDEVAEGGAQNLVLQLLPRTNLRPEIVYLKEDGSGHMTAIKIPVQVHQRQDAEFKTANVIQVVEDILNQDNSLRKGVVIQGKGDTCGEVIVYSLYKYFDEEDVKSYHPPQDAESKDLEMQRGDGVDNTLTKSCPEDVLEDQTRGGSVGGPTNVEVKCNVKLWNFWNCIEKGDLESLRGFQAETKILEQEAGKNQSVLECKSEGLSMEQEGSCKHVKEQPYMHMNTYDDEVLKAELVEVVDDVDEISSLEAAIETLQRATLEAKALSQTATQRQKVHLEAPTREPTGLVLSNNIHASKIYAKQESEDGNADSNMTQKTTGLPASEISNQKLHGQLEEPSHHVRHSEEAQTFETSTKQTQKDTEVAQKPDTEAEHSTGTDTAAAQEGEEVVLRGTIAAALNSLERSNINVSRGDFRAAMIYKNSSNTHKRRSQNANVPVQEDSTKEPCSYSKPVENAVKLRDEVSEGRTVTQSESMLVKVDGGTEKRRKRVGPKPAIPPKPDHLKPMKRDVQSTRESQGQTAPTCSSKLKDNNGIKSEDLKKGETCEKPGPVSPDKHQDQCSVVPSEYKDTDEGNSAATGEIMQAVVDNEPDVVFHQECKKIGSIKNILPKTPPVKPKRVRIAQADNQNHKESPVVEQVVKEPTGLPGVSESSNFDSRKDEAAEAPVRVKMRGRSRRVETEDERRQRLSVHMDEIMKDNVTTAMEIFDNLRRQEELKGILSRVEEMERDTSDVDVRSLRGAFESVPEWVVGSSGSEKQTETMTKEEVKETADNKSSMAHVFGDLERASEEIINLKEQTLARLLDIEGAIKKALYSVSTLKSESDIAGLSCLFKESMGAVTTSANISKISIGSSRSHTPQIPAAKGTTVPTANHQGVAVATKQRSSPPSSPAFISIQSAARKCSSAEGALPGANFCTTCQHSPMTERKFRTSKTLACNSPAQGRKKDPRKGGQKQPVHNTQNNPKREVSVLEVKTGGDGNGFTGAKTVTENYERTDNLGNRFYSTVITTQAETATPTGQTVMSVAPFQVTTYPEVLLPIHRKP